MTVTAGSGSQTTKAVSQARNLGICEPSATRLAADEDVAPTLRGMITDRMRQKITKHR